LIDCISIGTISQVVSSLAAAVGLIFTGWQVRRSKRSSDLLSIQTFLQESAKIEESLARAASNEERQHFFVRFLNFFEMNAAADNEGLFYGISKKLVEDNLCSSIALIEVLPDWKGRFEASVTSATTFSELSKFMKVNRVRIATRKAEISATIWDVIYMLQE
jgi:hypothetical protein